MIPYATAADPKAVMEAVPGDVGGKEGRYYQYRDVNWGPGTVRMHRFLTGREGGGVKPVYGLTA
jgi:coenzyme A diphosphatase NUDT7